MAKSKNIEEMDWTGKGTYLTEDEQKKFNEIITEYNKLVKVLEKLGSDKK